MKLAQKVTSLNGSDNKADPLLRQLDNFCAVIRGEAEAVVTARDGLQNLRVIEAIRRAVAGREAVALG